MALYPAPALPSIENDHDGMPFLCTVLDEEVDQSVPLGFEVPVGSAYEVVAVDEYGRDLLLPSSLKEILYRENRIDRIAVSFDILPSPKFTPVDKDDNCHDVKPCLFCRLNRSDR